MAGKLTWLTPEIKDFPPSQLALDEPNGLLAVGGDLSPDRLLSAYRRGIFPWYEEGQPILWWTPDPRMVLFPEECHVSRSLAKIFRQARFRLSVDTAFAQVIEACAAPRKGAPGTWITPKMRQAYINLHELGYAHSVEVWNAGQLVGGIYGVAMGAVFFGESMFSRCPNASKVAFVSLARQLARWGYRVMDCQVANDHLFTLGAREIPRAEFEKMLNDHTDKAPLRQNWREAWMQ